MSSRDWMLISPSSCKKRDWQAQGHWRRRTLGAARNSLLNMVELGSSAGGSEWLLTLCLNTTYGPLYLDSEYAQTLLALTDTKDAFYKNLASTILTIPSSEQLVLLGDFNARVGADNDSWPSCLIRDQLFAENAAIATHTQQELLSLMKLFSQGLWADYQPAEDKIM